MKEDAEKRAGIPHIRVHDLRHSYASLLINKGTDIAVISRLMGHGSPAITYKIYSHFYPETNYKAIEDEIVVSNAPSRPSKQSFENYYKDIDTMFSELSKSLKPNGFLVLTLKLGSKKYFNVLTKFINYAKKNGFEFVKYHSLDFVNPSTRQQAATLASILKQIIVVFQKQPKGKEYWYIGDLNIEQEIVKEVYQEIERSPDKYLDQTNILNNLYAYFSTKFSIIFTNEMLSKAFDIIKDNFYVFNHTVHFSPNNLYLGLENTSSLLLKLYDTIPVIIKKLLDANGSFVFNDLFDELNFMVFDGDTSITEKLLKDADVRQKIVTIIDNYCEVSNDRYIRRKATFEHAEDSIDISTLGGYDLERLMVELLRKEGYLDVVETGKSGDRGVDLIATQKLPDGSKQKIIFQCKRWIGNVGSEPIQRLHSMMTLDSREIKRAVCITTSNYTPEAKSVAALTGVELVNGQQLITELQKYYGSKYYHGALTLIGEK